MAMLETLVQLFAAFAKIGFTSFGGTSMIPLIMDEMSSHGWMTDADLTNLIAIAEMTPGCSKDSRKLPNMVKMEKKALSTGLRNMTEKKFPARLSTKKR